MLIKAENTAAIIVDVQEKLMPAMFNQEEVEKNVNRLVAGLKLLEVPMIVTQQYTKGIGMTIPSVIETFGDDFSYMEKTSFGVYGEAPIKEAIDGLGKKNIIVCGTETHVCVLQTCIQLKEAGYQPILVTDAAGSRHAEDRKFGIKRAIQEGVIVTTYEALLFELMGGSTCPVFRQISKIVK
ncbi:hydrolase [Frisingicoccus caecimuris]|jgi:nicotinamidase-related amidase|uniref:Nicotinamidase-related amidase n=1 Tax=Frisingicoccus caecimuris TaxID=1796636 RepID=A0A4R2LGV5_9FIRM|nr:hydrolase [Frisingicoccus caecimuris]MCR1919468.1 hydrolase [Frisingicoccus caecimuris]TCO84044.1 nicotinamidase-related amidase [Frisingicoccus caecimuris]HAP19912.1 hydrolase [Lachnospiraceae bacterium]